MDTIHELFLEAAGAAVKNERVTWDQRVSSEDWEALFQLASTHHMLPMFYEAVYDCPDIRLADAGRLAAARQTTRVVVMQQAVKTMEFLQLYRRLAEAGITALVVKGLICRQLYPLPDHRSSGDEDVLIRPEQYEQCKAVFTEFDMEPADANAETNGSYEVPFRKENSPLYIELHKSLFPPESDAYGDFNNFFRDAHGRTETVTVMDVPVHTLAPTDHMFYLICHAFKHLLHSGFGIRQVCDMMLFANIYGSRIHWDQILENCKTIRAHKFAAALFRIGECYLSFDPDRACYPECWRQIQVEVEPLLEELVCAGIYGQMDMSRRHSSNITLGAVAAQKKGKKSKSSLRASLFPSVKRMAGRYPYLKDKPWLLPVAWASRVVQYGSRSRADDNSSAAGILRMGNRRVALLKQYEIIE